MTATHITAPLATTEGPQATIQHLLDLAAHGLVPMLDDQTQLFCYKLKGSPDGLVREGQSPRYTAITLLGLNRLQNSGVSSPIAISPVLDQLLSNTKWVDNIGDLGLLLWLCAQVAPDRLPEVDHQLHATTALQHYPDAGHGQTMELAWLLTGLCYWCQASPGKQSELADLAIEVYSRLICNQGKHGVFGHAARQGSLAGRTRGWIGSFADQVYPIYAMALFYKIFGERDAEVRALQCGLAICGAQGEKGQWWWHYDSSTGHVIDGYPVFSVHQHAMAPMTLFRLGDVSGKDFRPWISRGLEWIHGNNELRFDMESSASSVVWRCIFRPSSRLKLYLNAALHRESAEIVESSSRLQVLFECRPYELGWLLYAFAGRQW